LTPPEQKDDIGSRSSAGPRERGSDRPSGGDHNGGVAIATGTLLRRGVRRRCPVCGQGRLFRWWVRMIERCPRCRLRFQREPGEWLGSWFLNICLAQVLVVTFVIAGVVAFYPHPPIAVLATVGGAGTVVFPLWFFPYSRTIWVAIDLAMRPLELAEGVAPQWELEADHEAFLAEKRTGTG
jgi:uncharacterized protein (DUF983 family)